MTHISAQWSYFETKRRAKSLSLSEEEEDRVSNRWPWTRWSKVQVDRPWLVAWIVATTVRWKGGRRKGPAGVHTPAQRRKRFLAAFDESETAFERTNAPARIWAPLNQWPSYENRSLFTVSLREPPTWSTLATLASFLDDICICVSPLRSGFCTLPGPNFHPATYFVVRTETIHRWIVIFANFFFFLSFPIIFWINWMWIDELDFL